MPSRKTLGWAALAAASLAPTLAHAQPVPAGLQIYGIMDLGVEINETGAPNGRRTQLNGGNLSATRLGFRGSEDLGGGLKGLFNLEMGIHADTGAPVSLPDEPTSFFSRRSVVGLSGAWGEVTLGRDYTPGFWTILQTDRFRYGLPGTISTPSQIILTRASNGVFYLSPVLGGFQGRLSLSAGEERSSAPKDAGRTAAASLEWRGADWFVSTAVQRRRDAAAGATEAATMKEGGIGAEFKLGTWTFSTGHWRTDPVTAVAGAVTRSDATWFGAGVTLGAGQLNAQVTQTNVEVNGRAEGRGITWGIAYLYSLSKRTTLYAGVGKVSNDANARLPLNTGSQRTGGVTFDADPRATLVGVRHTF
jgi:GBP family porin